VNKEIKKLRCTDLAELNRRTKSNPELIMEMISLFLEQTPSLINKMKTDLIDKDWNSLGSAAHKMIPSFSIMGISNEFETMARQIQEYSRDNHHPERIPELVQQLEDVCTQACTELKTEYTLLKKQNHDN
jgi:HPt (histidine-containing phosphotransfer) domain-containing protein